MNPRFTLRAVTYGLIILLGLAAALPSLLPPTWRATLPDAYRAHTLTLGLDLQGGSHLLLRVDTEALTRGKSGRQAAEIRDDAVARSLEVVRRRLDETGVVEPLITRQGQDGIVVQLPGVTDPGRIKELLGRTARLTFHLLAAPGEAARRLPGADDGQVYPLKPLALLDGGNLEDARLGFDPRTHQPVVNFRLDDPGAKKFADITSHHVGDRFAVVLDGEVITAPVIRSPITAGRGQISGGFDAREAGDLALLLRAGALPAPLQVVEQRTVGPDLGGDQIRMGITTGLLGAALVLGFMVAVYRRWGLIANTALVINLGLVVGILASLGATLTLPGIAGLILSVGMAVDANILINERIREEARRGRGGQSALRAGFQRAYATILDSNITTLIAVGLLFQFGSGPVRGFAVTMAVGLLVSLFTSISVTRLLMEWRLRKHPRGTLKPPGPDWLAAERRQRPIRFMRVGVTGIVLSLVLSVLSLGSLAWPGLNTGIDFQGGVALEMHAPPHTAIGPLRQALSGAGLDAALQRFGADGQYRVRLPAGADSDARIATARAALTGVVPDATFPRVDVVGPSVSGGFVEASLLALLLAGLGMFVYLRLRFAPHFAWAALVTLVLDVSKTLGFFVLTGVEFNLTAVAALLTLIGYSVNDKVVVFDRMRENQALEPDRPLEEIIDVSLTQTLRRTLFTSLTTFLAILPMGLAGGPAVGSFALPVLFGIVVGTSSSIWIAAPMALWLARRRPAERREEEAPPADPDDEKALFARVDRL